MTLRGFVSYLPHSGYPPEHLRCTSVLYYLAPLTFVMYFSMFLGPSASILKGKTCRYVIYDLPKYTLSHARKQISHSLDKGRVSEIHTTLVFLPFVLRLFCFNTPCQFIPLLNLSSLILGLTPYITLIQYF